MGVDFVQLSPKIVFVIAHPIISHPTFHAPPTSALVHATEWDQVLSCIPMCLSSVYKEKALGDDDMDVIYLNGWVAVFQFLASLLFAVPSAYAMGLPVSVGILCTTSTSLPLFRAGS